MVINLRAAIHPYAQAFIDRVKTSGGGDLSAYEKAAINTLVLDFVFYGLWNLIPVLFPFVGRNAIAHAINLIEPRRAIVTWSGSVTHNASGITGGGGEGRVPFALSSSNGFTNNFSFGAYCRTAAGSSATELGTTDGTTIQLRIFDTSTFTVQDSNTLSFSTASGAGFFASNRTSATSHQLWINGAKVNSSGSGHSLANPTSVFFLLSRGGAQNSSKNLALAYVGYGFTDAQQVNFYNLVQKFQTGLRRQV